jgi:hypothetical protein
VTLEQAQQQFANILVSTVPSTPEIPNWYS